MRVGLLLALQSDLRGDQHRLFFGHESFREFLVALHWAQTLRRIIAVPPSERPVIERRLFGARLLDDGNKCLESETDAAD